MTFGRGNETNPFLSFTTHSLYPLYNPFKRQEVSKVKRLTHTCKTFIPHKTCVASTMPFNHKLPSPPPATHTGPTNECQMPYLTCQMYSNLISQKFTELWRWNSRSDCTQHFITVMDWKTYYFYSNIMLQAGKVTSCQMLQLTEHVVPHDHWKIFSD